MMIPYDYEIIPVRHDPPNYDEVERRLNESEGQIAEQIFEADTTVALVLMKPDKEAIEEMARDADMLGGGTDTDNFRIK